MCLPSWTRADANCELTIKEFFASTRYRTIPLFGSNLNTKCTTNPFTIFSKTRGWTPHSTMSAVKMLLLAVAALVAKTVSGATCYFSEPVSIGTARNLELRHYVNLEVGTFTISVSYTGGQSFVAVGLQDDGQPWMTPSNAIIGTADSDGSNAQVQQYRMTDEEGVIVSDTQTLVNASFVQTDSTSTMTFTQKLDDVARALMEPTTWIFAVGYSGNRFAGHSQKGSFTISLTPNCTGDDGEQVVAPEEDEEVVDEVETASPTATPTQAATTTTTDPTNDDDSASNANDESDALCTFADPITLENNLIMQQYKNEEEGTYTMKLTYSGGQSWLAIGTNDNGKPLMTPARSVIGRVDSDGSSTSVKKYSLTSYYGPSEDSTQNLISSSFVQTEDTSTLTFTKLLDDTDHSVSDETQWIYAVGYDGNSWAGHDIAGSFKLSLTASCTETSDNLNPDISFSDIKEANRSMWLAHGILLALAWGVCAPIGIGASLLRDGLDRLGFPQGTWYKIHFYMNLTCILLTVIGFTIAVVAINEQYGSSALHFEGTHEKTGLAIACIVVLQGVAGFFRPSLPKAGGVKDIGTDEEGGEQKVSTSHKVNRDGVELSATYSKPQTAGKKSGVRLGWEWGHRLAGVCLIGMAWSNCNSGINLMALLFGDKDWTPVFWSIVGVLGGSTIIASIVLKLSG